MSSSEKSDEDLMRDYQGGDSKAFEILFRRHSPRVYGFLRSRIGDRTLADDLFQATFLKLHQARSRYDAAFPFLPWLFALCRNTLIDGLRERGRTLEDANSDAIARAAATNETGPELPDLGSLPLDQRKAVELRYMEDLPFDEIARRLETSPSNARQLVSRGVRRLRDLLAPGGQP